MAQLSRRSSTKRGYYLITGVLKKREVHPPTRGKTFYRLYLFFKIVIIALLVYKNNYKWSHK